MQKKALDWLHAFNMRGWPKSSVDILKYIIKVVEAYKSKKKPISIFMVCGQGYTLLDTAANYKKDSITKYLHIYCPHRSTWENKKKEYDLRCLKFEAEGIFR